MTDHEPGTYPGNDGRVLTTDPTHGRIPADIQWEVEDEWHPKDLGQRVALERTIFKARGGTHTPATPRPLNPECVVGKHPACNGDGWDYAANEPVDCTCICHRPAAAA
ncbi:hypothetical protein [Rathayibacter sp. VKM Ac-2927]|uniref:hypothetical protein n=1 Tax=Rathayibacter sp. VKM Ac-2927 TaxID=2929478 RepID=UPI001FB23F5F|nr:hypothetical protein [Rathayibacter sp. VKM Ac-2927]MCJ1687772.1 hypothetical protein [Rathayibacter sp. VKM Ac-2927]